MNKKQILKLKGKTAVFVDWANVYGWKKGITPKTIYSYLKSYPEIKTLNFYYGTDKNTHSRNFLKEVARTGFNLTTKPVKYIPEKINGKIVKKRKCDFDIEICMSVYELLGKDYTSFIFFSGDGDFAPLYQYLINLKKQVMVIYEQGHLGKEVWEIKKGLFKTRLEYLLG